MGWSVAAVVQAKTLEPALEICSMTKQKSKPHIPQSPYILKTRIVRKQTE